MFLYIILIPAPTFYFFYKERKPSKTLDKEEDAAAIDRAIFTNPVSVDEDPLSEQDGDALASQSVLTDQDGAEAGPDSPIAVDKATTARTLSESRAPPAAMGTHVALAKMQRLSKENRDQNKDLATTNDELTEEINRLAADNKKIQSELVMAQQQAEAAGFDLATAAAAKLPQTTEELQLQQWVDDETLTTETREVAKQSMDTIINLKLATAHGQLVAANKLTTIDLAKKKDTVLKHELEVVRTRHTGAFSQAMDARVKLRKWLGNQRLMNFEHTIVEVGGRDLSVEDLRYCREEDIDQMAVDMSFLEKRRFLEGIETLKSARVAIPAQEDDGE